MKAIFRINVNFNLVLAAALAGVETHQNGGNCFCRRCRLGGGRLFFYTKTDEIPEYYIHANTIEEINGIYYVTGSCYGQYEIRPAGSDTIIRFLGRRSSLLDGSEVVTITQKGLYIHDQWIEANVELVEFETSDPTKPLPGWTD